MLPQVGRGKAGRRGRVARAIGIALVEGQKFGRGSCEVGGDVDPVVINGEVGQAAAKGQERLFGVAILAILPHGMADVLAGQLIFELGGENGQAIEK